MEGCLGYVGVGRVCGGVLGMLGCVGIRCVGGGC